MTPAAVRVSQVEQRVLLKTTTARDAAMAVAVLARAGIDAHSCADLDALVAGLREGAGAVLIAEESLLDPAFDGVREYLHAQPPWSDLPIAILARPGADSPLIAQAMELRANITVVERPLRVSALVSTLRSALRGRARQYEMRGVLDRLEQADQRKNEFLATLAHELRNPLAPLSTGLMLLRHRVSDPQTTDDCMSMMQRQVAHMARLVDDLMQVSRITRGKIELQRTTLALDRVLADAIESCVPLIESRRHRLVVAVPEDAWFAHADGVRLTQVFANLITNAAKYTPPGGRIDIRMERDGSDAVVRFADSGEGIAPDRLEDIFGMFVQVGDRSRPSQGGLGIGLTLSESLVRLHGGTITARSAGLGLGSEFTVRLPLVDPPAATGTSERRSRDQRLHGTMLVVDDNRDAADSLAFLLRAMGADTHVAYDGGAALDIAGRLRPTIAILDIGMPGMDGCELARKLRGKPQHSDLKLIALTGWGQAADRDRIMQAGFSHHLLKPVDQAALFDVLRETRRRE